MNTLTVNLGERSYQITVGSSLLSCVNKILNLNRRVFIVTDSGVPKEYAEKIKNQSLEAMIFTVNQGETSKSLNILEELLCAMLKFGLTRRDCAVAVGGGVVGDLTGLAASLYMRGIDFYNVPTTLLSQVDSSIGGKTAINFSGIKNIIGTFYQPKHVLIDTDTLKTLPKRLIGAGLAESLKMALTFDSALFEVFEQSQIDEENIEKIILGSLKIKKAVVEEDEKESGLRKVLNFGHTFGHGIEALQSEAENPLFHGECIALGILPMSSPEIRKRLIPIYEKIGLPTKLNTDIEKALVFSAYDKKRDGGFIDVIFVNKIGSFEIKKCTFEEFSSLVCANAEILI